MRCAGREAQPGHRPDGRMERPAGEGPAHSHVAVQSNRNPFRQLQDREQSAEVIRNRVKATCMDKPRPGLNRASVMAQIHLIDELRLAGQIEVSLFERGVARYELVDGGPELFSDAPLPMIGSAS